METSQQFREAVEATREQKTGITLNYMAKILCEMLDESEVRALIIALQINKK